MFPKITWATQTVLCEIKGNWEKPCLLPTNPIVPRKTSSGTHYNLWLGNEWAEQGTHEKKRGGGGGDDGDSKSITLAALKTGRGDYEESRVKNTEQKKHKYLLYIFLPFFEPADHQQ